MKTSNQTNENFGMSCEVALCQIFDIKHSISEKRYSKECTEKIIKSIEKDKLPFILSEHIGGRDKTDFITKDGKSVSVKSNISGYKVCPQIIGQTTKKKFCSSFGLELLSPDEIKEVIFENIHKMINKYIENLFCCDYLIWMSKSGQFKIFIRKKILSKFMNKFSQYNIKDHASDCGFTWTRKLEQWNESNTLKWNGITIAEFQIHNHRNSVKMRFDLRFFMEEQEIFSLKSSDTHIKKKSLVVWSLGCEAQSKLHSVFQTNRSQSITSHKRYKIGNQTHLEPLSLLNKDSISRQKIYAKKNQKKMILYMIN